MTLTSGINLIKQFEGCRLHSYPDPGTGGKPYTIGWGSTKDTHGNPFGLGATITQAQADILLEYTIEHEYLPQLAKIPHWNEMSDNQKGALLSFAYNNGAYFMEDGYHNSIAKALKEKRWADVPKALLLYVNPGSAVEIGLRKRRTAEGELFKSK